MHYQLIETLGAHVAILSQPHDLGLSLDLIVDDENSLPPSIIVRQGTVEDNSIKSAKFRNWWNITNE